MTSDIGHKASIKQALDSVALDYSGGDTGLQVESTVVDGQWVRLTSMRDGLQRPPIPRIHAERVLQKTLPDGSPAFWIEGMAYTPPAPRIGAIKCYFHPDFDETDGPAGFDRQFIDRAGLAGFNCNDRDISKQNRGDFKSVMNRDAHMRSRHRRAFEVVEKALGDEQAQADRTEAQLDREYQRQQTATMLRLLELQIASGTLPATPANDTPATAAPKDVCDVCARTFRDARGMKAHQRLSKDEAHVQARAI